MTDALPTPDGTATGGGRTLPARRTGADGRPRIDYRAIAALALPLMVNSSLQSVINLTDTWFVGHISTTAMAGIPGTGLSLLSIPRGPLLDWANPRNVHMLGEALRQLAADQRVFLVQADPAVPEARIEAHGALEQWGFRRQEKHGVFRVLQPRWVMRIPLDAYGGPEGLLAALPHKTRYNIRLAERKGVGVTARADSGACQAFQDLLARAAGAKGYPVRGFRYHPAIWRHCVRAGLGEYLLFSSRRALADMIMPGVQYPH